MEALSKLLEILKSLAPFLIGFFVAKQDTKIDNLEAKIETIEKFEEIDTLEVKKDDAYDGLFK